MPRLVQTVTYSTNKHRFWRFEPLFSVFLWDFEQSESKVHENKHKITHLHESTLWKTQDRALWHKTNQKQGWKSGTYRIKHWNLGIRVARRCPGKINSDRVQPADWSIWLFNYVNNTYIVHLHYFSIALYIFIYILVLLYNTFFIFFTP